MSKETPTLRVYTFTVTYELVPVIGDKLNDNVDDKGFKLDQFGKRVMNREPVEWVVYGPVGNANIRNTERVKHMVPDPVKIGNDPDGKRYAFMKSRWDQVEPAYRAWKEGQEIPLNGTPLAVWPGVTPEQIDVFRQFSVRTVEEVAGLTEAQMERIRLPNMREMKEQAALFMQNMDRSQSAEEQMRMNATMEAMRERMEQMEQALAQATAELEEKRQGTSNDGATADSSATEDAVDDEVAELRAKLDMLGVAYDGRWAAPRLRKALQDAETQQADAAA